MHVFAPLFVLNYLFICGFYILVVVLFHLDISKNTKMLNNLETVTELENVLVVHIYMHFFILYEPLTVAVPEI